MKPEGGGGTAADRWSRWALPGLVVGITGVAFSQVLGADFVTWDDPRNFLRNPHYRGLGWANLRWMLSTSHTEIGPYIPLTWLSLGLDYTLWGMDARGYHLTNLLLFLATTLGFYFVALRLLQLTSRHEAVPDIRLGAAAAALAFAIHPLRVESVAWISERRDVLAGLFYVSTVIAYLRSVQAQGPSRPRWYWGAVGLYACSLLAKPITATLPAALLLLDVYPLRRLSGTGGWLNSRVWAEKAPFGLLAAMSAAVAFGVARPELVVPMGVMGIPERLVLATYGLAFYVFKTLVPLELSPLYPLSVTVGWGHFATVLAASAVAALMFRRWPAFTAAWLFYAVTLFPVSGVFQRGLQSVADRYSYLPALGFALLAGGALARRWTGVRVARVVFAVWIAAMGFLTWQQTSVWTSSVNLWRHAVTVEPGNRSAHINLAGAYDLEGRRAEALAHFSEVLRLSRDKAIWLVVVGHMYEKSGVLPEAMKFYREALRLKPGLPEACELADLLAARLRARPPELESCRTPRP